MNKNSSLGDIIDAVLSLNLGITFYTEENRKKVEIHDSHGLNYKSFILSKDDYQEIIGYLAEKLDQPTIEKLENGQVFECHNEWIKAQAFRISGVEEKYTMINLCSKPKFFNAAKELLEWMNRDADIEEWTEIK